MIICRTPYRISFFGGGTDFPEWYMKHGGSVVSCSIDKYCHLAVRYLPPFFEHRIRVVWTKIETCADVDEVTHPAVKAILKDLNMKRCIEIHHIGDLPARSGMGTSSAFSVGLLHALHALKGRMISKQDLAMKAIRVEQELLKEVVGSQDQVCAAYGGLNHIEFFPNGQIAVIPLTLSPQRIEELNSHLMLFYTGIKRTSSDVAQKFLQDIGGKKRQLRIMKDLVDESISILNGNQDIRAFGELLKEAWDIKRSFSKAVSNQEVEDMLTAAYSAGALGGKITGAGGGGFLMLFAPPERHKHIKRALNKLLYVPFKFDFSGSQVIFANLDADYSAVEMVRDTQEIQPFRENTEIVLTEAEPHYAALKNHLPQEQGPAIVSPGKAQAGAAALTEKREKPTSI